MSSTSFLRLGAAALMAALSLAACSSTTPTPAASSAATAQALSVTDPWVKAADSGMTAAFGTLVNDSDQDAHIVSATTDLSTMELHEMATNDAGEMVMRPKEGGFVVPAHGQLELGPGGDHLMFMDLTAPIEPGDDVSITLQADDGSSFTFSAPARSFSGADESYDGDGAGTGDMDMSTPASSSTP